MKWMFGAFKYLSLQKWKAELTHLPAWFWRNSYMSVRFERMTLCPDIRAWYFPSHLPCTSLYLSPPMPCPRNWSTWITLMGSLPQTSSGFRHWGAQAIDWKRRMRREWLLLLLPHCGAARIQLSPLTKDFNSLRQSFHKDFSASEWW